MITHRRPRLVTSFAALALVLAPAGAACGSGSDETGAPAATTRAPASEGQSGVGGDVSIPSDLPLDSVARGLEVAMEPEDIEIDGDTLHVYIGEDGKVPVGTECTIVTAVLPDGATAVIHRGDEETTC